MLLEDLKKRGLPELLLSGNGEKIDSKALWNKRRLEIINLLKREVYGFSPNKPDSVNGEVLSCNSEAYAGKAVHLIVSLQFDTPKGNFSFPINLIIPKKNRPVPLFINIAFRPEVPDRYYPAEEIVDNGFACATFCYKDVAEDSDDNFAGKLAGMYTETRRAADEWGKISMWAWAASRVMDYVHNLDEIDKQEIAVVGHSRLGKTALWCAAQDERFKFGISNNSGCSGAAITRGKKGEQVKDIISKFSYWFCDNYKKYVDNEGGMPFDQHFLLAAIAPRLVYVASSLEDQWADPQSEFLSCVAASSVYEMLGLRGLVSGDEYPAPGTNLHEGNIGYHLREGSHFFSRYDWLRFMEFFRSHYPNTNIR